MTFKNNSGMRLLWCLQLLSLVLMGSACATSSHRAAPVGRIHEVTHLQYESLRYRKPPFEAANPKASPGGVDYRTQDRANWQTLDCKKPELFFQTSMSSLAFEKLDSCLKSLSPETAVSWRLVRGKDPSWSLEVEPSEENRPGTPECLKESAMQIPLPREVFFMGKSAEGLQSCFASRPNWDEDVFFDVQIPYFAKKGITLWFPSHYSEWGETPRARVLRWLDSVVLSLWAQEGEASGRVLPSVVFPDEFCRKCMGEAEFKALQKPSGPAPEPWTIRSL